VSSSAGRRSRAPSPACTTTCRRPSGHNSLRSLGPPPGDRDLEIAIGYPTGDLRSWFSDVHEVAHTPTPYGLDNGEADQPVYVCRGLRGICADLWPEMLRTG
jgi:hypothetical protein